MPLKSMASQWLNREGSGPFVEHYPIFHFINCQLQLLELMFFLSPQHIFLFCFVLKTELLSSLFVFHIALFCGFVLKGINQ